jgi:feruloyl esterase
MTRSPIRLILLSAFAFTLRAADLPAVAPAINCDQLATADFSTVADAPIHITSAAPVADGKPAPYCKVTGYIEPQVKFEVRLPLAGWTQRFLQTGCGGLCGNLSIHVSNAQTCPAAENGELALASTDMGHEGMNAAWGDDPKLRIDFAYRGVHVTTLAAKAIIAKYYGRPAKYSYFAGCSDGGREALMEAERYPNDFDGVTAGAPAMNFITQNTFYHGWNARVNTDTNGHVILTADKLPILHSAALESCDAVDGDKDGLINDPRNCHFDPGVTLCKVSQEPSTCLTEAQVNTAREIYRGAHDAKGNQLVLSGPQVGSELAWKGVEVPGRPDQGVPGEHFAMDTLKHLVYHTNPPSSYALADLHFDQESLDALKPVHPLYDATDPDLKPFAGHGGKLILWHGWSDQHISPLNTISYFAAVNGVMGEKRTQESVRLYLFPGGYHCGGGEGPFNPDLMSAIMAWVEDGKAPANMLGNIAPYVTRGKQDMPAWLGSNFFKPYKHTDGN